MKKRVSKIILTLIAIIYLSLAFIIPEKNSPKLNLNIGDYEGAYSEFEDNKNDKDFGVLDIELEQEHGYGYIKDKEEEPLDYGIIEFENSEKDTNFRKRVSEIFAGNRLNFFNAKSIDYAIIDDEKIYIENGKFTNIKGFNGEINLGILIDISGKIDKLFYLSSKETQSYVLKIINSGFFDQFSNLKTNRKHKIDAVSGATITSVAIAKAVNEMFSYSGEELLDNHILVSVAGFDVEARLNKLWIFNLILLLFIFVLSTIKKLRKKRILLFISIFSIAVLGFYLNSSFTWLLFPQMITNKGVSIFTTAYISLVLWSSIWGKNTYCKYVCPFGNSQKLLSSFFPNVRIKIPIKNRTLRLIRYLVTIFIIVGYFAGLDILSEYELFPYFFGLNYSLIMFYIAILMLMVSIFVPNLWCRALCPTGCVLDSVKNVANNNFKSNNFFIN